MPLLLHLDSSIDPSDSVSRALTSRFAAAWRARGGDYSVVVHDLVADPVPHLPHHSLHWPARLREGGSPVFPEAEALQNRLIDELLGADAVVVGAPMYNYSIPSTLKTWLDDIHVPGRTALFDGDTQPMKGRHAVIISSRGATYDEGTPTAEWDHTVAPIEIILGTALGMDVDVVTVSRTLSRTLAGMADERDRFEAELSAAQQRVDELAASI
ncbi:FMN-dependent NADH-azoreductase [Humibacter sp. RRB41]|uniref:FMN-dependent NADH-azoreductase n=1 Tax=Humibacter sp. RRB41 TaxID=2919946 RepID=UPI001FA9F822|nr:NAD(P)H-dependent oxidoreductase [Humibacter sp. RRB41]